MRFSFLHTADIHLGRPFSDIIQSDEKTTICNHACEKTFCKTVDLAISRKVDFVLIVGDSFDSDKSNLSAELTFVKNLKRLADNGIKTYVICGNHDPAHTWDKKLYSLSPLINIVGVTTEDNPQWFSPKDGVNIYALSFVNDEMGSPKLAEPKNIKEFNIALLHCELDKTDIKYAPISCADLKKSGYDYYALGHIHIPEVREGNIVYAGTPQARTRKEVGAHGCYIVEVEDSVINTEFVPTDFVRFVGIDIDCSDCETEIDVCDKITAVLSERKSEVELELCELNLIGRTKCYKRLAEAESEIIQNCFVGNETKICKITNNTAPLVDESELLKDRGVVGILMSLPEDVQDKICEKIIERHRDIYKTLKIDKESKEFLIESLLKDKEVLLSNIKNEIKSVCAEVYE